ncbi:MAG: dicarboxylate/amino acid:cation symporter [Bacteroidaceae bacterium]|nr:dicarboxylate/amino acid:cation symporter [Bacteroidaceae bacterium]
MKILNNSIVKLLLALALGIVIGQFASADIIRIILSIKQISGQIIFFLVPLIILGFVAPSIAQLKSNASRIILFAFGIAYLSSVGAAFFSVATSYQIVPLLNIQSNVGNAVTLPEVLFQLDIPPVMSVISALLLAVFLGLGTAWTKADLMERLLQQFQQIVLKLVTYILLPILPIFVAANFAILAYQGDVARFGIFLPVILIVIVCHYIWLALLYGIAALYSGKNSWHVLRHYAPAYFTALGTMSSAATLGVALDCAHKSDVLDKKVADFSVPLFANIHLCGSVLTEVFFIAVTSQLLYGQMPTMGTYTLFILLLGIFAIGAPGVPGGTVLASLGLVISIVGFDDAGTALLITIFALQDSFGTACNVTGDGALTLMVQAFENRKNKKDL